MFNFFILYIGSVTYCSCGYLRMTWTVLNNNYGSQALLRKKNNYKGKYVINEDMHCLNTDSTLYKQEGTCIAIFKKHYKRKASCRACASFRSHNINICRCAHCTALPCPLLSRNDDTWIFQIYQS